MSSHASVVVTGGGITGCSTLYHLAKEGVTDAILLARNRCCGFAIELKRPS